MKWSNVGYGFLGIHEDQNASKSSRFLCPCIRGGCHLQIPGVMLENGTLTSILAVEFD
jgi:hypothetical protein